MYNKEDEDPTSSSRKGQPTMALNHQLARDIGTKEIVPPHRYVCVCIICYALNMAQKLQKSEPKTFKKSLKSKDSKNGWMR